LVKKTSATVQSPMLDSKKSGSMLINLRHKYEVICIDTNSASLKAPTSTQPIKHHVGPTTMRSQ